MAAKESMNLTVTNYPNQFSSRDESDLKNMIGDIDMLDA
jgi:hypothetical protein